MSNSSQNRRNKSSKRRAAGPRSKWLSTAFLQPDSMIVTLPFTETWDNTTGAPGFYDWVIRGNSVYDPDFALSADSAYGLDNWKNMYYEYKVISSHITVTVTNNDADDPVNVSIIPALWSGSFSTANQDGLTHHPNAKSMVVAAQDGAKKLSNTMASARIFHVRDLDSVNFSAEFTANPATIWYWHVVSWNNAGTASDCEMKVEVLYRTAMFGSMAQTQ